MDAYRESYPWGPTVGAVLIVALSAGCGTTQTTPPPAQQIDSPIVALNDVFVASYQAAAKARLDHLKAGGPIILNDFLNMTLYRPGAEPTRFNMKKETYFLMARASHPALAIYAMLSPGGLGPLTSDERIALDAYREKLRAARGEIPTLAIDLVVQQRIGRIYELSEQICTEALNAGTVTEADYLHYASQVRPLIEQNLEIGAREQLEQFRDQLAHWRTEFPAERWDQLHVVVLGFHQARELYATKLFFQWLLREPEVEDRVVYAEVLIPPFGASRAESHDLALELLAKVSLDRDAAALVFGDERVLARDVMGPAANSILETWGQPEWP